MTPVFIGNSFIFLICILFHIQTVCLQQRVDTGRPVLRKHIQMCQQYKSEVYEKVYTFSAFIADAPEIRNVVDDCKPSSPFIVGGTTAKAREFPHMARLGNTEDGQKTNWFCAGSLISKQFVLTAAHCFFNEIEVNRVRLGELIFESNEDDARPIDYYVKRIFPYPSYDRNFDYHDIGLVQIDGVVTLSEYVVPACLPLSSGDEFNRFLAVGWGSTDLFDSSTNILMKVTLDQYRGAKCNQYASLASTLPRGLDENTQLCAGSSEKKDTCTGDSGGPLLQYHNQFKCIYQVVGVTSTGIGGCGIPNVPGIYTRVYNYVNWIERIVW